MINLDFFDVAFDNLPKFKISFVEYLAVFLSNLERVILLCQMRLHCSAYTVNEGEANDPFNCRFYRLQQNLSD